jgi:type IV pilus assembly protein PilE
MRKRAGFTLLEIMVAMIIMGMLITIALPKYGQVLERSRQAEAVTLLGALRGSQLRYYVDNNNTYTSVITNLDIDLGTTKFFTYPSVPPSDTLLATASRNGVQQTAGTSGYQFSINRNGVIVCSSGDCAGGP